VSFTVKTKATMSRLSCIALLTVAVVWLTGCAIARPVLYPDRTLKTRGREVAQEAVDACIAKAKRYGAGGSKAGRIAKNTTERGAEGAAAGAAGGAIYGNAGTGAATGAAVGGAYGLIRSLFGSSQPSPAFKRFVDQCLRNKGYQPIGWQ
jgi:hypothetical protein